MAGYSGTPLIKKLGLKEDMSCVVLHAPEDYAELLGRELPNLLSPSIAYEWLQGFYGSADTLEIEFPGLKESLMPAGQLWISWPKKSSGVTTDLDENVVREIGLAHGLVDVKVASIDDTWSGLKFVYRISDR
jgi:hypothetical protein